MGLVKGDIVNVYTDPATEADIEGCARIKKVHADQQDGKLVRCDVVFVQSNGDEELGEPTVTRWINEENRILN